MKYGILGGFIKLAFANTAFAYMEKAFPEMDMGDYRKRVLKEYRAIVERTKTLGYGDDECNFHLMSRARAEELGFMPGPDAK